MPAVSMAMPASSWRAAMSLTMARTTSGMLTAPALVGREAFSRNWPSSVAQPYLMAVPPISMTAYARITSTPLCVLDTIVSVTFGMTTLAPDARMSSRPCGTIVSMAVVAGMLASGSSRRSKETMRRVRWKSPGTAVPSGVSGFGIRGPMPTMSASSCW